MASYSRGHRHGRVSRGSHYDGVATLLPLRSSGPPTDISEALEAMWAVQRPEPLLVPNLPSVVELMRAGAVGARASPSAAAGASQLSRSRVSAANGRGGASPRAGTPSRSPRQSPSRRAGTPHRTRSSGIHEERRGEVRAAEQARFRGAVSRKLLELYDEVVELDECSGNMEDQLRDAMRADPRRVREAAGGLVRLAPRPTAEQEAALAAVVTSLHVLRDSCVELVAAYLTGEEKLHMGMDTHLFQTRATRASTYQYGPGPRKSAAGGAGLRRQSERVDAAPSAPSTPDAERRGQPPPPRDASAAPSSAREPSSAAPFQHTATAPQMGAVPSEDGAAAPLNRSSSTDAKAGAGGSVAAAAGAAAEWEAGEADDAAHAVEVDLPSPPAPAQAHLPEVWASPALGPGDADTDEVAEGTPERQRAPAGASVSSLGGGTPTTSGVSPMRPVPPVVVPPAAVPPAGFVPVGMAGPKGGPVKLLVKKVPINGGVKQAPFPMPAKRSPMASQVMGSQSQLQVPAAAPAAAKQTPPPTPNDAPPSAPASTSQRPSVSAPAVRSEFRRFMIDTDSDSLA